MAGTLPPLFTITDSDHSGYVCVALYTLLILTALLAVIRIITRWYVVKFIKADDIFLVVAAVRKYDNLSQASLIFRCNLNFKS